MTDKKENKLELAIDRLADLFEFGQLLSSTGGYDLLNKVSDEIEKYRQENERLNQNLRDQTNRITEYLTEIALLKKHIKALEQIGGES